MILNCGGDRLFNDTKTNPVTTCDIRDRSKVRTETRIVDFDWNLSIIEYMSRRFIFIIIIVGVLQ